MLYLSYDFLRCNKKNLKKILLPSKERKRRLIMESKPLIEVNKPMYHQTLTTPGERLKNIRNKLKLSRNKFYQLTGFNVTTLEKLESGKNPMSISKAKLLATLFIYRFNLPPDEVNENYILHGDDPN